MFFNNNIHQTPNIFTVPDIQEYHKCLERITLLFL